MTKHKTHLALDGPLNGQYINPIEASENGYELAEWTADEWAYLHVASSPKLDEIPEEIQAEINAELA